LLNALNTHAPVSIRVNTAKTDKVPPQLVNVPWCSAGYYLPERPLFAADPAFHAGHYYVQEASSMVVGNIVSALLQNMSEPSLVLDLCAAPGGKSTLLASLLRPGDMLVANEIIATRTPILHENLCKWGAANHVVTRADASLIGKSKGLFNVVVADLPCSGEGMFRKDPAAINEWSENNVKLCAERQQRIVKDNINKLAVNLGANIVNPDFVGKDAFFSLQEGMHRALPHRTPGEGFFVAVLQKNSERGSMENLRRKEQKTASVKLEGLPEDMLAIEVKDALYGMRNVELSRYVNLLSSLPGIYAPGTPLGRQYHGKWKPEVPVALLQGIENTDWPVLELSDAEIMQYLHREALPNPRRQEGVYRVKWNDVSAGFVNANRHQWNNLWPMEWRLRMVATEPVKVLE
jgi:16S rRNA C967 or C1407 C5-methylase (RsmB/RsmF family)